MGNLTISRSNFIELAIHKRIFISERYICDYPNSITFFNLLKKESPQLRKHILVILSYNDNGIPLDFVRFLANKSKEIPFGCKFVNNRCNKYENTRNERGCCYGCRSSVGYLRSISPIDIDMYSKKYNRSTGFWKEGIGCTLDRKFRSLTCLSYSCYENSKELIKYKKALGNIFTTYVKFLIFMKKSDSYIYKNGEKDFKRFYEQLK